MLPSLSPCSTHNSNTMISQNNTAIYQCRSWWAEQDPTYLKPLSILWAECVWVGDEHLVSYESKIIYNPLIKVWMCVWMSEYLNVVQRGSGSSGLDKVGPVTIYKRNFIFYNNMEFQIHPRKSKNKFSSKYFIFFYIPKCVEWFVNLLFLYCRF